MLAFLALTSAFVICYGTPVPSTDSGVSDVDLLMPNVITKAKDTYLCMDTRMNDTATYIVGFKPKAKKEIAHHILLYGCTTPGSSKQIWSCGEMAHTSSDYSSGPVCGSGSQIIYAWAMDAPDLKLPADVAFKVGGNTEIKHLVLQIHYKTPISTPDHSGIVIETTKQPTSKRAGVLLMGTGGSIRPHSTEFMETACEIHQRTPVIMHPFAFRTHTHTHGLVVSGFRIRDGTWTEIGRKSPKLPQMFYNVTSPPNVDVRNGDIVAARCTMRNDGNNYVNVGATQNDEMCNFYMMYYVNGENLPQQRNCFSAGPPYYSWQSEAIGQKMALDKMPKEVSLVPGTTDPLTNVVLQEETQVNQLNQIMDSRPRSFEPRPDFQRLLSVMNSLYDPQFKMYENEY